MIHGLTTAIHIKDDVMVSGKGIHLKAVLDMLQKHRITIHPYKRHLGQPEVKWFGEIYSKLGMSPNPPKCKIIKEWPAPKSNSEVKSFLQTVQFNAKFMGGKPGHKSYPELTQPLRVLTKKYARFRWGQREEEAFVEFEGEAVYREGFSPLRFEQEDAPVRRFEPCWYPGNSVSTTQCGRRRTLEAGKPHVESMDSCRSQIRTNREREQRTSHRHVHE